MFIPSVKSKFSLIMLFIISVLLFIWVNNSRTFLEERYFKEKTEAAELMKKAEDTIKEFRTDQGVFIDKENDKNQTGLIGEKETIITTDRGSLTAKLTSLNPNFAAIIVEMLKDGKLRKGDKIAVSCTGSFPAMNIAVLSAAKTLGLEVVMISSVGASMFGATDPEFTWLDMETLLNEKNIFPYKSVAASLGGGRDLGRGLNKTGRNLIETAIERNGVQLIKSNSLEKNISAKMDVFSQTDDIKMYVNIGGGLSGLGNSINGKLIRPGLHRHLSTKNIPLKGTMFLFADKGIPILHLLDIEQISEKYELPISPEILPAPGEGSVFVSVRYNITFAIISLIILIILIVVILVFDHHELKLKEHEVNMD
jgi:poly-gamma-glutamate system protein